MYSPRFAHFTTFTAHWENLVEKFVEYAQTVANRQRQFTKRSTGSRLAVKWYRGTGSLINHLLKHENAHRKSICKTRRKYSARVFKLGDGDVAKSTRFDSNRTTRHSKWRPIIPDVELRDTSKTFPKCLPEGGSRCCQINTIRLITVNDDPSHQMSICKTFRKHSTRVSEGLLKMLVKRHNSTRIERPVIPDVDLQDTQKIFRKCL